MVQDPNDMLFCEDCRMNVFPTRPKFKIKIFGVLAIFMICVFTAITFIFSIIFSGIFLFIYFMWGFMIVNPYLVYYGLQPKLYCPICFKRTTERNLEYKPFGDKQSEIYKTLTPSNNIEMIWYCPYCGNAISKEAKFCKSCGKKFEIKR